MPNLRVYRYAWVAALILAIFSLFTLGTPATPLLSDEPASFDAKRAMLDLTTLAEEYGGRAAGSDADARAAIWVVETFQRQGLETHIDTFTATLSKRDVALQNVWAFSPGTASGTIVIVANRDSPPGSTQGADANASGTATLLELARVFAVTGHEHTLLFLSTDGDAYGALGARRFIDQHGTADVLAVVAMRRTASRAATALELDGWGAAPKTAPPWLWLLSARAAKAATRYEARLPRFPTQALRLAVPTSSGSQAPFVAAGVPAISLGTDAPAVEPATDTLDGVTGEMLTTTGRTAETMVLAIDGSADERPGSGGATFLRPDRTLSGGSLALLLLALFIPLAAVATDMFARCRRRRRRFGPVWARLALHVAPWLAVLSIIYFSNLAGLLPRSPGAVIPPESGLVDNPSYLRVAVLLVCLLLAYAYAAAVERRLARRVHVDQETTVFVAHAGLLLITVSVYFVNPYSLLLVAPAAVLWPLARPGDWTRSVLPVYLGLGMIAGALVFFALRLGLGFDVWWYFFLLLENRTIPASAALLGAAFLATAGMLAHTLHGMQPVPAHVPATTDAPAITAESAGGTSDTPPVSGTPDDSPGGGDAPSSVTTPSRNDA